MFSLFGGKAFSAEDVPDLKGKSAIITGANSGLGLASTYMMAGKGCQIIMACRSQEKTNIVIEEIKKSIPDADVTFMELDLSDLKSIRNFVVQFKSTKKPIHILMNNAGIMALDTFALSKNDVEMQLATNYLGPFYLTSLLLPIIKETATSSGTARIVNLSSAAHSYTYKLGIDFENINNAEKYSAWSAYGQSKLANILFSNELQKKLEESSVSNIFVNSVHPGIVSTNLASNVTLPWIVTSALGFVAATPASGALTQVYCATSNDIVEKGYKGMYFVPTATMGETSAFGKDEKLAHELWEWSERTLKEKGFESGFSF